MSVRPFSNVLHGVSVSFAPSDMLCKRATASHGVWIERWSHMLAAGPNNEEDGAVRGKSTEYKFREHAWVGCNKRPRKYVNTAGRTAC